MVSPSNGQPVPHRPNYNFAEIPSVRGRRPLWDSKHPELADWKTRSNEFHDFRPPNEQNQHRRIALLITLGTESVFFITLLVAYAALRDEVTLERSAHIVPTDHPLDQYRCLAG